MSMQIAGCNIDCVAIVDDDQASRQSVADIIVNEMDLKQFSPDNLSDLNTAISIIKASSNAVISDHRLKVNAFSLFNGAELVAELYKQHCPALLCTSWSAVQEELIPHRKWIPKVLEPPLSPEVIIKGFELCLQEFKGEYRQWRNPWRALVRIEDINRDKCDPKFYIVIPSWNPHRKIMLPLSVLPDPIANKVQPNDRLHVQVNLGSEDSGDLYFSDWEEK